jgi:hypothetical protein
MRSLCVMIKTMETLQRRGASVHCSQFLEYTARTQLFAKSHRSRKRQSEVAFGYNNEATERTALSTTLLPSQ